MCLASEGGGGAWEATDKGCMVTEEIERLLELGRIDLEAGYPQYARQYFEKVLALDASNQEAIDALARIDEILSHRIARGVKPTQDKPVQPPPKVATKRTGMHGLAATLALAVVVILAWLVYMSIEPRREVAVAPTAAAISIETPKPTPTLKPLPTPTGKPPTVTPILPTATPRPTATAISPTATPKPTVVGMTVIGLSGEERNYLANLYDAGVLWATVYFTLEDLITEDLAGDPSLLGDTGWQVHVSSLLVVFETVERGVHEMNPPVRFGKVHQSMMKACAQADRAASLLAQGVEGVEIAKIAEGWAELMIGMQYMEEMKAELAAVLPEG
jgi:hypothetical protein